MTLDESLSSSGLSFPSGKGSDWVRTLIPFSGYWMVTVLSTLVIGTASPGLSVT